MAARELSLYITAQIGYHCKLFCRRFHITCVQLYSSNRTIEDAAKVLEMDGKTTGEWDKANYLEGNLSKYQVMMMTKGHNDITEVY